MFGQRYIPAMQTDGLFRPQSAVVRDAEERHQPLAAGTLSSDCPEQEAGLPGIDHDVPVDFQGNLRRAPLEVFNGILIEELELDCVLQGVEQDRAVPPD